MTHAWIAPSSGRFEIVMTLEQAESASHAGQCDADVRALSKAPEIAAQVAAIDPAVLRAELGEYGAWTEDDLADHEANVQRVIWLAAGDIVDEAREGVEA